MVKKLIRGVLGHFGLQLRRIPREEPEDPMAAPSPDTLWLRTLDIKTVLDIGANTGQFARHIRHLLPEAMIYSFEPLAECFEELKAAFAEADKFTAFNVALSDQTGELPFERNEYSQSSSFLRMADLHRQAFPFTKNTDPVAVRARRLDDLSREIVIQEPLLVKIDVQGYEDHVLRGGEVAIRRARVIVVETSFRALYEGQPLFDDIYRKLVSWRFVYGGALNQLCSPQDGRPLQEDSIFIKPHP